MENNETNNNLGIISLHSILQAVNVLSDELKSLKSDMSSVNSHLNNVKSQTIDIKSQLNSGLNEAKSGLNEVKSQLNRGLTDMKSRMSLVSWSLSSNMASLRSRVTSVDSSVKFYSDLVFYPPTSSEHIAKKYYQEYGLGFAGFGLRQTSKGQVVKYGVTLADCLDYCQGVRDKQGKLFNGLYYYLRNKGCYCQKQEVGHVKNNNYLHYKFI